MFIYFMSIIRPVLSSQKNAESQVRTKYIYIQHYYIQELTTNKGVMIEEISSANILADNFTKSLKIENFKCHRDLLGIL